MRNKCIDTLKGISCILVVFIHHPFPGQVGEVVKAFARIAVPLFFMISGYYFGTCPEENLKQRGTKMILRCLKLFVGGFLFSESLIILKYGSLIGTLKAQVTFESLWRFALYNKTGEIYHLWFVCALVYSFLLFMLLHRYVKKYKSTIYVFIGIIFFNIVLGIVTKNNISFDTTILRSWLFTGVPFFGIGFLYPDIQKGITHTSKWLILLGCVATIIEYLTFGGKDIYIGTVLLSVGLLSVAIAYPDFEITSEITKLGERYSMLIYILHWGVMHFEYKIISIFNLREIYAGLYMYLSPIFVFVYTVIISIVVRKLILVMRRHRKEE